MFGAVNDPVPPPEMLPVSNRWLRLSVTVWATESRFVTVTFCPALTVMVPEKANPLMTMPEADAAVAPDAAGGGLLGAVDFDDELHEASTIDRAAVAAARA